MWGNLTYVIFSKRLRKSKKNDIKISQSHVIVSLMIRYCKYYKYCVFTLSKSLHTGISNILSAKYFLFYHRRRSDLKCANYFFIFFIEEEAIWHAQNIFFFHQRRSAKQIQWNFLSKHFIRIIFNARILQQNYWKILKFGPYVIDGSCFKIGKVKLKTFEE